MNLDELGLVPVERANTKASTGRKGPIGPKNEPFDLRRGTGKNSQKFTITTKAFEMLQMSANSAKQFNTADKVLLAIMPGNTGVFLKNTAKGAKGRSFKNEELAKALDDRGINAVRFAFQPVGEKDGARYFVLSPVAVAQKAQAQEAEGATA